MKLLLDGEWRTDVVDTPALRARRVEEKKTSFRQWVSADGSTGFAAQPGRYHLYVSYACPWAHRTIIFRALKKLETVISMSVLHPRWGGPEGWQFKNTDMSTQDHVNGFDALYQTYQVAKPDFMGKVTVPVLWDKHNDTIVNNESGEIIEMFNSAFDEWGEECINLYPEDISPEIEALNDEILNQVCMGVYKVGFASTQNDYDLAIVELFATLDRLETRLAGEGPYLLGPTLTVCDIHLFATLARFDAVYHSALKCSLKRLIDYPALSAHTRRIHDLPGIADTVKLDHIMRHYFDDLGVMNPAIVPKNPAVDFRSL